MIDWRHWHNEPVLVGGLVFLGWLWAILAGPLRAQMARRAARSAEAAVPPFPRRQAWFFYSSLILFYLAVGSPLDQVGERFLFSAHMFQHLVIMYPAPVLMLCGVPWWMVDAVLDHPATRRPLRLLLGPLACGVIFIVVISVWHAPWLYDWALQDKVIHVVEHLMFYAVSVLFWWPILSPSRAFPPLSFASRMLYIFCVEVGMTPIFAYVTFTNDILYPTYEYAPRLFATFTANDDQTLAGVMMKLTSMAVSMIAFGYCFYRWSETNQKGK
ncbi:MAG: cytochrome c oxidase assembly protein [Opitutaceae bacterium]